MKNEVTLKYESFLHAKTVLPDGSNLTIGCGSCGEAVPSPKDLFVAGYASCVIMSMDMVAKKNGFNIAKSGVRISPVWSETEPLLTEVNTTVVLTDQFSQEQLDILRNGVHNCPIHNSLKPEIKRNLNFEVG